MTHAAATSPPADHAVRELILTDLDRTFFVEAGAGTGKTTATVARIVNLVAAGRVSMPQLAAITFTEAAAAELRDRVREGLERAAADPARTGDERSRCQQAAADVDQASISTIHAFAGQLLRMFPLEAGLPPGFATLDEIQQELVFEERFSKWFWRDALQEPLRTVLKRALLLGLSQDTLRSLAAALDETHDLLGPETVWDASQPEDALKAAAFAGTRLRQLQRCERYALDGARNPLVQTVRSAQSSARQLLAARDEDDALSALVGLGWLRSRLDAPTRWADALDGRNAGEVVKETLDQINDRVHRTLDSHRSATLAALLGFVRDFVLAGGRQRRANGAATFHDLLAWARDLLRDNAAVRHAAQARFARIFIDEFQDTDPLQAEIAFYLAADERDGRTLPCDWRDAPLVAGKLFVVGDPKQSIYRFRGADIAIYDDVLERLRHTRERLTHNFRSVQPVLDWVNHHFDRHMRAEPGVQPEYVPLTAQWSAHQAGACGPRRIGGAMGGSAAEAAEAEASSLASLARRAVADAWLVSDRDANGARVLRPARYRDMCILLPGRTHLRRLERALERLGVPYRVQAGKLVLATQDVRDLLACLRAIEDPSDQVALVAALRSPAYACSDVDLLSWVEGGGQLDHEQPGDGPDGPVKDALLSLAEFHRQRLLLSPPALIDAFMADRMLVASAFGQARPREAWRRLRYVVARARAFTGTGRHTLRAFLDWIDGLQRAEVRDPESASVESDEDAIHIQTIHGAKGLEYPIVMLGGLAGHGRARTDSVEVIGNRQTGRLDCRAGRNWQTVRFGDAAARERRMAEAEAIRLLYVAATRARDHLVLSLFRGERAEDSSAGHIERRLAEAPPALCPRLVAADDAPRAAAVDAVLPAAAVVAPNCAPMDVVDAVVPAAVDGALETEHTWRADRQARIAASAAPAAYPTWWSTDQPPLPGRPAPLPAPPGVRARRNVSLLAEVAGLLLDERVDLVYQTPAGSVVVLRSTGDSAFDILRAGRVALAFQAATRAFPTAVEWLAPDGRRTLVHDVRSLADAARAELAQAARTLPQAARAELDRVTLRSN
jgi:ATP-dependent helicase/nuclease subunit A